MRTFAFAALAAIATAQSVETKGTVIDLPENRYGALTSGGQRWETMISDETTGEKSVWFSIIWDNALE
jgi:hypothetical protein